MSEEIEKKQASEGSQKPKSNNRHRYGRHHRGSGQSRQNQHPKESQAQSETKDNVSNEQKPQKVGERGGQNQHRQPQKNKPQKKDAPREKNEVDTEKVVPAASESRQSGGKDRDRSKSRQRKAPRESAPTQVEEPTPTILDSFPDDDLIFGGSQFAPKKKVTPTFTAEELDQIRKFTDEELFGTDHLLHPFNSTAEDAVEVVSIRFKKAGKSYYFDPCGNKFSVGDFAILDTARGLEFGEVSEENRKVNAKNIVLPLRQVIRRATKEDVEKHISNKQREEEAFGICLQKIANHKLDMKLVDAQYAFDNSKLLFYFTSAGRVDFRELVRDLASVFKTRIELRQIGIRDEAKMLGGIGICGRPLCCSRFLSNFAQVSIKMAKEQGLSLNSGKISGNCGRLMCCLNFENQTYLDEIKLTPMPGSVVKLDGQTGTVTEATPLIGMLKIHLHNAPDGETVTVHRDSITVVEKKLEADDDGDSAEE